MKNLKKILLALFIATSVGAFSTAAVAETDAGRITYKPADAIDMVVGNIAKALEGINGGASGEEAYDLIKKASDASKEINANDKVDRARSKANKILKEAMEDAKGGKTQVAEEKLKKAEEAFNGLKSLL